MQRVNSRGEFEQISLRRCNPDGPKDRSVRFDYRLRRVEGQWRIIDIYLDGKISELVMWRGQSRSLIENEGFEKLVEALEERITELRSE